MSAYSYNALPRHKKQPWLKRQPRKTTEQLVLSKDSHYQRGTCH